jgi:rfaE bifunctional protein kinase chain/domain
MKNIEDIRILVVGDIMLDKYVVGDVERISPEAPVPVVKVTEEYHTLGGCGNVVRNIAETGAKVDCAASISNDYYGERIIALLNQIGVGDLLIKESEITIVKERIIADQRKIQMIRIDKETTGEEIEATPLIEEIESRNKKYDIIVVSDYAKGVITWGLMEYLYKLDIPVIVDPKPQNDYLYNRPFMITPNKKEWIPMEIEDRVKPEYVLITEGKEGMTLIDYRSSIIGRTKIEAEPVEVYNVSGAGDTVTAMMAVCLSIGLTPLKSAVVANKCAAYVVTQTGTSVVPKDIFNSILNENK